MPPSKRRALASRSKRKRKFFGVRKQDILSACDDSDSRPSNSETSRPATGIIVEPNFTSTPKRSGISKSEEKLQNSSFETIVDNEGILTRSCRRRMGLSKLKHVEKADDGYSMIDLTLLQEAFESSAICNSCKRSDSKLSILRDCRRRHGLAERLIIKCSACSKETIFNTSRKIQKGKFEVNTRSVLACNTLKGGRKILSSFCGIMNLVSPLAGASYSKHLKSTASIAKDEAEKQMKDAAKRIRKRVLGQSPNADKQDEDGAISVAVSLDGTWQRRGYSSRYGVVVAILVDTGEVVDFEVLSMHCHECSKHLHEDKDSETYKNWKAKHEHLCQINYQGSSGGMEGAGAIKIFQRSIANRGLKYTTFVGDGDSDTFKVVCEEIDKLYGKRYKIVKEECIGHIQKRMGNALRALLKDMKGRKMSDNKTIGGKGRLTKERIDSFQRFYGNAIRANSGNLSQMQTAIWAIFHHSITPPTNVTLKEQHKFCPKGKDSWCKFNVDLESNRQMYDKSRQLPSSFHDMLKPIFDRLASKDLLEKCLKGVTQNANESLNHMIWERCPKATFCSKVRIETAVAEAVCCFNTGAGSKALILRAAGIEKVGQHSLSALQKEDHTRLASTSQKITRKYKNWRVSKKASKMHSRKSLFEHYDPGAFDSKGEKCIVAKKRKTNQVPGCCKRGKIEQVPTCDQETSLPNMRSCTTDLPVTFAVPLQYIQKV